MRSRRRHQRRRAAHLHRAAAGHRHGRIGHRIARGRHTSIHRGCRWRCDRRRCFHRHADTPGWIALQRLHDRRAAAAVNGVATFSNLAGGQGRLGILRHRVYIDRFRRPGHPRHFNGIQSRRRAGIKLSQSIVSVANLTRRTGRHHPRHLANEGFLRQRSLCRMARRWPSNCPVPRPAPRLPDR